MSDITRPEMVKRFCFNISLAIIWVQNDENITKEGDAEANKQGRDRQCCSNADGIDVRLEST